MPNNVFLGPLHGFKCNMHSESTSCLNPCALTVGSETADLISEAAVDGEGVALVTGPQSPPEPCGSPHPREPGASQQV